MVCRERVFRCLVCFHSSVCSIEDGKAKMEVWRRQGETNGRLSKFPDMVEEIETIRGNDELPMKCVCT